MLFQCTDGQEFKTKDWAELLHNISDFQKWIGSKQENRARLVPGGEIIFDFDPRAGFS